MLTELARYLAAACAATVWGMFTAWWLAAHLPPRRRKRGRGAPSGDGAGRHIVVILPLALALTWVNRDGSPWALAESLFLLFLLHPLVALDVLTLSVDARIVLVGLVARLGSIALWDRPALPAHALGMVVGAGMITLAAFAYRAVRGRSGLGEGDAGVLALAGAFVGWQALIPVLLLAAGSGVIVGLVMLLRARKPLDTPIPFVPFLCAGTLLVHVAQRVGWAVVPIALPG